MFAPQYQLRTIPRRSTGRVRCLSLSPSRMYHFGTSPKCDIQFSAGSTSSAVGQNCIHSQHCWLTYRNGAWVMRRYDREAHVKLDGHSMGRMEQELPNTGAEITIGRHRLLLEARRRKRKRSSHTKLHSVNKRQKNHSEHQSHSSNNNKFSDAIRDDVTRLDEMEKRLKEQLREEYEQQVAAMEERWYQRFQNVHSEMLRLTARMEQIMADLKRSRDGAAMVKCNGAASCGEAHSNNEHLCHHSDHAIEHDGYMPPPHVARDNKSTPTNHTNLSASPHRHHHNDQNNGGEGHGYFYPHSDAQAVLQMRETVFRRLGAS